MRFSSAEFNKRLALLHHLNIKVLYQRRVNINAEKRSNSLKCFLNVLRICLKLFFTNSMIQLFILVLRITWSYIPALLNELCFSELHFLVDSGVVIESVKHDQAVCK